jgi:hypothetical protein
MTVAEREQIAEISDALLCWDDLPDGARLRWWCKLCRDEGNAWLTDQPCEHVLTAKEDGKISREEILATLEHFKTEARTRR